MEIEKNFLKKGFGKKILRGYKKIKNIVEWCKK